MTAGTARSLAAGRAGPRRGCSPGTRGWSGANGMTRSGGVPAGFGFRGDRRAVLSGGGGQAVRELAHRRGQPPRRCDRAAGRGPAARGRLRGAGLVRSGAGWAGGRLTVRMSVLRFRAQPQCGAPFGTPRCRRSPRRALLSGLREHVALPFPGEPAGEIGVHVSDLLSGSGTLGPGQGAGTGLPVPVIIFVASRSRQARDAGWPWPGLARGGRGGEARRERG
jgi:hypothetical protein